MAKVPLAGTNYIPGVTEERTLARDRARCSRSTSRTPVDYRTEPADEMPGARHGRSRAREDRSIDAEYLAGRRFPYQEDISLVEDVDLLAATPGEDINWLEDIQLLDEDGTPAVFDRYSNSFLKIYFPIPAGRENEIARKVLITHLQSGNSYGIQLKEKHAKFPQPELGPWRTDSPKVGENWEPAVLGLGTAGRALEPWGKGQRKPDRPGIAAAWQPHRVPADAWVAQPGREHRAAPRSCPPGRRSGRGSSALRRRRPGAADAPEAVMSNGRRAGKGIGAR